MGIRGPVTILIKSIIGIVDQVHLGVAMALNFALAHERPAWLVLDTFLPTAKVFQLARSVGRLK